MPDFLEKHSYSEVNDVTKGIFQDAFTTSLSCYEYLAQNSKLQGYMQEAMSLQKPEGDWASALRIDEAVQSWSISEPTRVLFVDIGGGLGHQCIRLRETYPDIAGRVILQDMPITIGRLTKPMPHGIEAMEHNFDNLQPIKNAKFYYVRNVLHGLPDSNCIAMLKKIAPSMNAESVLVIDDIVIPDIGARSQACQLDFIMMASIAGMKRTRQQWHTLLKAAGFNVVDIRTYSEPLQDSLILASLAC
ncbi:O-methyl transferase B [Metarhizium guizhouense ARSEF 977]|uniref:O-methyl transferase B n=1 Tax=Metarhizium guizhouense (strain ARSEF 977) TaxID=1276136 RepID=A0A0B4GZ03_METGA|nr:O-methyl transferase B [Metarhizium guizhouense ARSEF 977]